MCPKRSYIQMSNRKMLNFTYLYIPSFQSYVLITDQPHVLVPMHLMVVEELASLWKDTDLLVVVDTEGVHPITKSLVVFYLSFDSKQIFQ